MLLVQINLDRNKVLVKHVLCAVKSFVCVMCGCGVRDFELDAGRLSGPQVSAGSKAESETDGRISRIYGNLLVFYPDTVLEVRVLIFTSLLN